MNLTVNLTATIIAAVSIVLAPDARACVAPSAASRQPTPTMAFSLQAGTIPTLQSNLSGGKADNERKSDGHDSIVGTWIVNLYVGTTPQLYDRVIEQFSADGNELMSSALFPPSAGNVCFGVWKASGNRIFKLRHIGWTFDKNGTFDGTARLAATLMISPQGDTFTGSYVADIVDSKGNIVPGSVAKGNVRGSRFTIGSFGDLGQ